MVNRSSTLFLRGAILLIGAVVAALCLVVLPMGIASSQVGGYRFILLGMYVPALPFFIGLYQGWRLLDFLDQERIFTAGPVGALQRVQDCALSIAGLYILGLPYIYIVAEQDDAPGVIVIALMLVFAPLVVATLAAVVKRILSEATVLKTEHDLTV